MIPPVRLPLSRRQTTLSAIHLPTQVRRDLSTVPAFKRVRVNPGSRVSPAETRAVHIAPLSFSLLRSGGRHDAISLGRLLSAGLVRGIVGRHMPCCEQPLPLDLAPPTPLEDGSRVAGLHGVRAAGRATRAGAACLMLPRSLTPALLIPCGAVLVGYVLAHGSAYLTPALPTYTPLYSLFRRERCSRRVRLRRLLLPRHTSLSARRCSAQRVYDPLLCFRLS